MERFLGFYPKKRIIISLFWVSAISAQDIGYTGAGYRATGSQRGGSHWAAE